MVEHGRGLLLLLCLGLLLLLLRRRVLAGDTLRLGCLLLRLDARLGQRLLLSRVLGLDLLRVLLVRLLQASAQQPNKRKNAATGRKTTYDTEQTKQIQENFSMHGIHEWHPRMAETHTQRATSNASISTSSRKVSADLPTRARRFTES